MKMGLTVKIMTVFFIACTLFSGCTDSKPGSSGPEYRKISQLQAKEIMDGDEPYTLVDVRTKEEYDELHIQGAVLIPVDEIADRAEMELPDKGALILVYCRSGVRSKTAAETLAGLGYTDVQDIGGINTWPYDNIE